ncbi:MAG: hypothetical protein KN64_07300 [Sulfurovum sp. AS07-7]|nr:MAG: hypothetical protein KN64_07300 [Sulfurovum sp. AS07-7]
MCAIFGIVGEYDLKEAKNALFLMEHRGPDSSSYIFDKNFFLGHNRLSIIDLDKEADQPFVYQDIALSFNGEIYNYKELKEKLPFNFKTKSDTETIIAAYKTYGLYFINYLRGMFAIALKDGNIFYLFRDRFGKKPLFYYQDEQRFIFASEIKAILPFVKKEIDLKSLSCYLSYGSSISPRTFYKGIKKLSPGYFLTFKDNRIEIKKYYDFLQESSIFSEDEAIEKIEEAVQKAVDYRLVADVEVASFLSGGIDSSIVSYFASTKKRLTTFSIGYRDYPKYSELEFAKKVADHIGSNHHEVYMDKNNFLDSIQKALFALDEPLGDPAVIPLIFLFENVKKYGIKAILSGEGGDELFMGYRQYFEFLDIEKAKNLRYKNWLKNYFKSNFSLNKEWEWYKRVFEGSPLFRTTGEIFTDLQKNLFLKQNIKDNESLECIENYLIDLEPIKWYSYIDIKAHLGELYFTKLDRASMINSIEARTPLIDQDLVELSFKIDSNLKIKNNQTKYLLRKIGLKYLPKEIILRKKKGFSYPFMEWLVESKEIEKIRSVNKKSQIFRDQEIDFLLSHINNGNFKQHGWLLYIFSLWLENNI